MNAKLIEAAEALADKASAAEMGYEAKNYAEAALALVQAACSLHYAEMQTPAPSDASSEES
jgi:hypothetical protein